MTDQQAGPGVWVLDGAVNTGVLIEDGAALLLDCCDSVTPERLAALDVERVERILLTQHRRPHLAGAYAFASQGAQVLAPAGEAQWLTAAEAYWADWRQRWHVYHHQPQQVAARPLPVAATVTGGDVVEWRGHRIRILATPGPTAASVSYLLEAGGARMCYCGDVLCGPGQVSDLYSLQRGEGDWRDYHAFLGGLQALVSSLEALGGCGADLLVPSRGSPIADPQGATALTRERLLALLRHYTATSALNFYFPHLFAAGSDDPLRLPPAPAQELPSWVRRVAFTSFALISESGAALLVDCGHDSVLSRLEQLRAQGDITRVEACWVSHYHDDHVDSLGRLVAEGGVPIWADEHLAEVLEHPQRFFLPCISPNPAPVARVTRHGETQAWHEFQLTFLHLPGQTFYHGGMLVEGRGTRLLFAGDSFAPTGLDDYCAPNRLFSGPGRGYRRCLELLRECRPDCIINQHQERAFAFDEARLAALERNLQEREAILSRLLPWPHPDFGLDEHWARAYPYEQEAAPGATALVEVHLTNHADCEATAAVEPVLPAGWRLCVERSRTHLAVPPRTDGLAAPSCARPDGVARLWLAIPPEAPHGLHVLPIRITWDGRYLGPCRHALVWVRG